MQEACPSSSPGPLWFAPFPSPPATQTIYYIIINFSKTGNGPQVSTINSMVGVYQFTPISTMHAMSLLGGEAALAGRG